MESEYLPGFMVHLSSSRFFLPFVAHGAPTDTFPAIAKNLALC
jgi:hypothetical protein